MPCQGMCTGEYTNPRVCVPPVQISGGTHTLGIVGGYTYPRVCVTPSTNIRGYTHPRKRVPSGTKTLPGYVYPLSILSRE